MQGLDCRVEELVCRDKSHVGRLVLAYRRLEARLGQTGHFLEINGQRTVFGRGTQTHRQAAYQGFLVRNRRMQIAFFHIPTVIDLQDIIIGHQARIILDFNLAEIQLDYLPLNSGNKGHRTLEVFFHIPLRASGIVKGIFSVNRVNRYRIGHRRRHHYHLGQSQGRYLGSGLQEIAAHACRMRPGGNPGQGNRAGLAHQRGIGGHIGRNAELLTAFYQGMAERADPFRPILAESRFQGLLPGIRVFQSGIQFQRSGVDNAGFALYLETNRGQGIARFHAFGFGVE